MKILVEAYCGAHLSLGSFFKGHLPYGRKNLEIGAKNLPGITLSQDI